MDIYTIIFAALAVFICLRLRSVLGQRGGSEHPSSMLVNGGLLTLTAAALGAVFFDVGRANWYLATVVPTISGPASDIDGVLTLVGIFVVLPIVELLWSLWDKKDRSGRPRYLTGILLSLTAVALGSVFFIVGRANWYPVFATAASTTAPTMNTAWTISGHARVVDGDTVVVAGTRVRLKGVDAAELGTARGENARRVMVAIVTEQLTCRLTGEKTHGREVGYCTTADGTDINQAIIARGAALAWPRYDARYVPFEQAEVLAAQQRSSYCVKH